MDLWFIVYITASVAGRTVQTVYTHHPGFQKGSKPLLALDNPFPMELPENHFRDKWAFILLPFSGKSMNFLHAYILAAS